MCCFPFNLLSRSWTFHDQQISKVFLTLSCEDFIILGQHIDSQNNYQQLLPLHRSAFPAPLQGMPRRGSADGFSRRPGPREFEAFRKCAPGMEKRRDQLHQESTIHIYVYIYICIYVCNNKKQKMIIMIIITIMILINSSKINNSNSNSSSNGTGNSNNNTYYHNCCYCYYVCICVYIYIYVYVIVGVHEEDSTALC